MKTRAASVCLWTLGVLCAACYDPHAQGSSIVRGVEAAGSGNLDTSSPQGLGVWFGNHRELATKISKECEPLAAKADAHWAETAESRVCSAARGNKTADWKGDARTW